MRLLLVVLLLNFNFLTSQSNEATTMKSKTLKRTIVSLIFSNKTVSRVPSYDQHRKSACQWLKGFKRQNKQCQGRRGFAAVLHNAKELALNYCVEQFKYDRWNCEYKKSMFQKIYRETAFMYAISASAIMFSAAKACNDGKLQRCYCAETPRYSRKGNWQWGGCGDNTKKARKIASKFLQINNGDDVAAQILNHNMRVGYKTVKENEMKVCICHGLSSSCLLKTCWKIIKPFSNIVESLRQKYQAALKVNVGNPIYNNFMVVNQDKLLYLAQSPNFCENTAGRRCKDRDHCATLCCGRGNLHKTITIQQRCHCRWQEQYLNVTCRVCNAEEDVYNCV